MATTYWDSGTASTSGTTWPTWTTWTTSDTSTSGTGGTYYYTSYVVRQLLVPRPEHWSDEDQEAFVRLVNIDTNTG
ncbi:hypothetical protein LCGC14_2329600, partial [marine sediment metagenome]